MAACTRHPFFVTLNENLKRYSRCFQDSTGYPLFDEGYKLTLVEKSYESIVDKMYRINVKNNKSFPDAPEHGWMRCEDVFSRIHDLVRGTIVCRYLDGPEYLVQQISALASTSGARSASETQQRSDEGHFYGSSHRISLILPDIPIANFFEFNEIKVDFHVEIQVTTRFQELLYDLTHWVLTKKDVSVGFL